MPHFVRGVSQAFDGNENGGQDFIRLKRRFAVTLRFRRLEEFFRRDLARLAFQPGDRDGRAKRNQRRAKTGRVDEQRGAVIAKDGMITVFSFAHERRALVFGKQPESIAVIPATRSLAQVTAHRANGHQLRAANPDGCRDQRGEVFLYVFVLRQFRQRGHRADAHVFLFDLDAFDLRNVSQTDDPFRFGDVLFERRDEVGAAGEDFCFPPLVAEQRGGFLQRFWGCVFE